MRHSTFKKYPIHFLPIGDEQDVVAVRQCARQIAALLGCNAKDQVQIATATSEIARVAFTQALEASAEFFATQEDSAALTVRIKCAPRLSQQPIPLPEHRARMELLSGEAVDAARRLMDRCNVQVHADSTETVVLEKSLNSSVQLSRQLIDQVKTSLAAAFKSSPMAELQQQNRDLVQTLSELRARQEELTALTRELEDTNRGVVALYAEIEEKANRLRDADAMKTRFLSNTSHELRTPLSSIRALAKLLLDRVDGDLTAEQETQVSFIERAAEDLSALVNDLLDLAKIEAGKTDVYLSNFTIGEVFSALRGILKPLSTCDQVELVIEDSHAGFELYSDEGKVSQIMRNFVSNSLKFTESGEVRVTAEALAGGAAVRLSVVDTGIGIQPADIPLVFEEFGQIENPLQKRIKGTGLGLPLCRKLATLLNGELEVKSEVGSGSTFSLILPKRFGDSTKSTALPSGAFPSATPTLPSAAAGLPSATTSLSSSSIVTEDANAGAVTPISQSPVGS